MKSLGEATSNHHILIGDDDWEFFDRRYGATSPSPIGVSQVIRLLMKAKRRQIEAREAQLRDQRVTQVMETAK